MTRPEPGLSETMRAVAALGYAPLAAPLLSVRRLRPALPQSAQAILLTSVQAAAALAAAAPSLRALPVLAVGDSTARSARLAGFTRTESASGDAARLEARVVATLDPGQGALLLACGLGQARMLAGRLRAGGFRVVRRCLYEARPVARLPVAMTAALQQGDVEAALFFSGETASAFVRLLPPPLRPALASLRALAISAHAAEPLHALSWRSIEAAAAPNAASLVSLLG